MPAQDTAGADFHQLPPLGFIAVECFFTRPPGDAWHEQTWPFPIVREMASGSSASQLVTSKMYDDAFINRFIEAGTKLAKRGCVGIITSCGFLALCQPQLAARLPIPIATSSLIQIPSIIAWLPPQKDVGIVTFDGSQLTHTHFAQLGIPNQQHHRLHIAGPPRHGALQQLVREGASYDRPVIEMELVSVAKALVEQHPNIGAIVLECTQMPPFAGAIHQKLGIPVYDVYTMGRWFYEGLIAHRPTWETTPSTA